LTDPVTSFADIIEFYAARYHTPAKRALFGIEWERMGVRAGGVPVQYIDGYELVLQGLVEQFGWEVADEEAGHIFMLRRGTALITTEADGKPEISGSPHLSLLDARAELVAIAAEINAIAQPLGIEWITSGTHPYSDYRSIKLAPKPRYQLWRQHISGAHAQWMEPYMKEWCGAHFNIDCASADELMRVAKSTFRLTPVLTGIFANSPMSNGQRTGVMSTRRRNVFGAGSFGREQMPTGFLADSFDLPRWLEWFYQREMYIMLLDGKSMPVFGGKTFADFVRNGHNGTHATFVDFDAHIKTFWIDSRPRLTHFEFRALDTLPLDYLLAAAAFYKGVMLAPDGHAAVADLIGEWAEQDFAKLNQLAWERGARAEWGGMAFHEVARRLLPTAEQGLAAEEVALLAPLRELIERRVCVAEVVE